MNRVLMIGSVWPEPKATAAGFRDISLLEMFQSQGWDVTYVSPAKINHAAEELKSRYGLTPLSLLPNDSRFDSFIKELNPNAAVFDRFVMEEQFGWRIRQHAPECLRITDTQDIHFIRHVREEAARRGEDLIDFFNRPFSLSNTELLRELASLHRSDHVFVVSETDRERLIGFGLSPDKITVASFFYPPTPTPPGRSERKNFVAIGNFRHYPNQDALLWLRETIWPEIRRELPTAEIHVYGAYPPKKFMDLTDRELGFWVKGPAKDQFETLRRYAVSLAPLRIGAGIKGKIADSWWCGTPVITTPVGAEGMNAPHACIAWNASQFVTQALAAYTDDALWKNLQLRGLENCQNLFSERTNREHVFSALSNALLHKEQRRARDITSALLWHDSVRAVEYMSRWIELKNRPLLDSQPSPTP